MSVAQKCKASWHWLIPDEDEPAHGRYVWRCVDDAMKAWHVLRSVRFPVDGKKDINSRSIGIEIVNAQVGEKDYFSDWQLRVTAAIVNYCRVTIGPDRPWYLATHAYLDPNRKLDPGHVFDWDLFMRYIGQTGTTDSIMVVCEWPDGHYKAIPCEATIENGKVIVNARMLLEGVGLPVTLTGRHDIREVLPKNWTINDSHIAKQGKCYVFSPSNRT